MPKRKRFNAVISFIIMTDFLLTTAASVLSPIFALFIVGEVSGGSARVVGFALAIYWIVKSTLQLPIAKYLDRNHGEMDDYYSLLFGAVLGALVMAGYFFARETWHVYVLQGISGIADAFLVPPFYAIFTRHLDKDKEGFEWSVRSSLSYGVGAALGGTMGGLLLSILGFRYIFILGACIYLTGTVVILFLRPFILPKTAKPVRRILAEHKKF